MSAPALSAFRAATTGGDVFSAVLSLWSDNFSSGPFTAIYRDRLPPNVTQPGYPYVIVTTGAAGQNRRRQRSNFSEYWEHFVTFKVYHRTHEAAEEHLGLIGNVFDDCEKDLDFYLQPEGESQSSQSDQLSSASNSEATGVDGAPPAGTIELCDRLNEFFGEEDRVVRFAAMTYRILRRKRRRGTA